MNIFKRFCATLRLYEAVRLANKAHRKTGERYYVIPNGRGVKLIITDRKNFRKLKQKHYIHHKVFVRDLTVECFYCTPYRNGSGALSKKAIDLKRRQYIKWCAS